MRRFATTVLAILSLALFALAQRPVAPDRLVVHEWGTFTSMQGSDGVFLDGLQHEEERLPAFVYSRTEVRECPLREVGYKGLEVPVSNVTQKMETPVIYFHSRRPLRVRVRVDFVDGLITQWYPVSDLLGPPESDLDSGPLDLKTVKRSFLQWDVDVLGNGAERPAEVPEVDEDDPWAFARKTSASWIRTVPRSAPRLGPTEAEKYLFYRGLGTFATPLRAITAPGGKGVLRNTGEHAIGPVIVMEMTDAGGRFTIVGAGVPAGDCVTWDFSRFAPEAHDRVVAELRVLVAKLLAGEGLHHDEAAAMVDTWSRQWFTQRGTRALYVLPRPRVDALLPLSIEPAPAELVRVLVGRLEIITPEVEKEVRDALRLMTSDDRAESARGRQRLVKLDRFLEPHLRNLLRTETDARVIAGVEELLASLTD